MKKWWHQIIGYQIYPRSFQDTNHDGVGDLPGITAHLDDLKDLGVNAVWLCPINRSPMMDGGYDVSDYDAIDPVFGSKEDLKELIDEARKREIRVLMDLVVNHTSSQHPWFRKALEDPEGVYGKYYIFRKGENGHPPNNWQSFFGGSAWERIEDTEYYYLHLFTKWQPDLNWENPILRQEIYDMVNRWLDLGIAGFRLDAINHIKKDFTRETGDGDFSAFTNVKGIGEFLVELRDKTYGVRDAFSVGEVNEIQPQQLETYVGEEGYFSSMFDFTAMHYNIQSPEWRGKRTEMMNAFRKELFENQKLAQGKALLCNVMENHDTARVAERFYEPKYIGFYSKSMLGCINFFMGGIAFLYQGQAIGMMDYPKERIEQFKDFTTFNLYEEYKKRGMTDEEALFKINAESREHARTPMQWNAEVYGGFSDVKPWFDVNPDCREINFEFQKRDENSLYSFYKKMIALRKREDLNEIFIYGETIPFQRETDGVIAYERKFMDKSVWVFCNTNTEPVMISDSPQIHEIFLTNYGKEEIKDSLELKPFQVLIFH